MNKLNKKEQTNKVFMAFATGTESTESVSVKRYIGVAPVFIKAINPSKKELENLYNTEIENEPEYTSITEDENGNKTTQIRIDFIVKTDAENSNNIDMTTKVSFFLKKEMRYNRDKTKVQVINKYGETTWLPIEDAKSGIIPENLSWFEPADFRPAYIGEEDLTKFIKTYLGIPNKSFKKKTGEVVEIPNKADAEARLDNIQNYFKGDVSELKSIIALQETNKVKCMFGVKTTDEGKEYQTVYTQMFLKNNIPASKYDILEKDLIDKKANGAYSTSEFSSCPLTEYRVESTTFTPNTTGSLDNTDSTFSPWG